MRIPVKINKNTQEAYKPSKQCLELLGEASRQLLSENFEWDQGEVDDLITYCVKAINKYFERNPVFFELPLQDQEYLLELLDTELPLEIAVALICDEFYWEKRYFTKFGYVVTPKIEEWTWRSLFLKRYIEDLLEEAQPEFQDENDIVEVAKLCSPFIKCLVLRQLKVWRPRLHLSEDELPEVLPVDHIDFRVAFQALQNLEEIGLIFGERNVGESFSAKLFQLSPKDCSCLIESVNSLEFMKILRIHRSRLDDEHVQKLCHGLILNQTLTELELSHCLISDNSAFCIAKVLMTHPTLEIVDLSFNRIKSEGAGAISYALLRPDCCPLRELYIQFNPLGEQGCVAILTILVHRQQLETVSIAGCQIKGDAPLRIAQMLSLNTSMKRFDISNNTIGEDIAQILIQLLENNQTLQWLDVRKTQIDQEQEFAIEEILNRNRPDSKNIFFKKM